MLLSDRPRTGEDADYLGFTAYADALAELIDSPQTDTPLTIAISAEWGAGKTSLQRRRRSSATSRSPQPRPISMPGVDDLRTAIEQLSSSAPPGEPD